MAITNNSSRLWFIAKHFDFCIGK